MSKPKPMPSYWALAEEVTHLHGQLDQLKAENAKLVDVLHEVEAEAVYAYHCLQQDCVTTANSSEHFFKKWWHAECELDRLNAENAKLRELVEHLQPIDCEGNVLDIADTVSMLRSEYDGDHEWDDVVVELALTKWGGDRWIVRGSKGEAWACDCLKTGYDEDAYEGSDDAEPIVNPSLIEVENAKLRELAAGIGHLLFVLDVDYCVACPRDDINHPCPVYTVKGGECLYKTDLRELGVEL